MVYKVTAEDGSYSEYTVTVIVSASSDKDIITFTIAGQSNSVISGTSITVTVPYGTDVTSLVPSIGHTGVSISPESGVSGDFTHPVTYTVTDGAGVTKEYTVTVSVAANNAKDITSFSFTGIIVAAVNINGTDIDVTVPYGTDVTNLIPIISHTGQSISPESGISRDFTNSVVYTVTAEDGSHKEYNVNVIILSLPLVSTGGLLTIKGTSASVSSVMLSQGASGVTSKGICWNTSGEPTLADSFSEPTQSQTFGNIIIFETELTGLTETTVYYVRAYATNSNGTAYGEEISFNSGYTIDGSTIRFGGYVFYNDGTGGGFVCSIEDLKYYSSYEVNWGDTSVNENGANSEAPPELYGLGHGRLNTEYIYNTYGPDGSNIFGNYRAFFLCKNYSYGGYDDWFLPSHGELIKILLNIHRVGLGNFTNGYYWSSSEDSSDARRANAVNFASDTINYSIQEKSYGNRIRAARSF